MENQKQMSSLTEEEIESMRQDLSDSFGQIVDLYRQAYRMCKTADPSIVAILLLRAAARTWIYDVDGPEAFKKMAGSLVDTAAGVGAAWRA